MAINTQAPFPGGGSFRSPHLPRVRGRR